MLRKYFNYWLDFNNITRYAIKLKRDGLQEAKHANEWKKNQTDD